MPMGKGTYGSQQGRPKKKVNMASLPPKVKKRLMELKKKKRHNPFGKGSGMNPSKASRTTGP